MMRRTEGGRVVEAERNSRMLATVWTGRMLSLMAEVGWLVVESWRWSGEECLLLPSQMLTLMEMLSAESSLLEVLEATEPERERMMMVVCEAGRVTFVKSEGFSE